MTSRLDAVRLLSEMPLRERLIVIGLALLEASAADRVAAAAALIGVAAAIGRRLPMDDRHKVSKLLVGEAARTRWNGGMTGSDSRGRHAMPTV